MPSPRESPPEEAATPACSDCATPPPEADADPDDGRLFNATTRNARGAADNHSRQGGRGQQQSSSSCSPCSTPVESRGSQRQGALRSARSTPGDLGCAACGACGACGARLHPQLQPPPLRSARSSPADVSGGRPQQQQPPPRRPHAGRPASCPEHTSAAPPPASRPATPTPAGGKEAAWQRQVPLLKSVSHAYIATARLQQQLQQYHHQQPAQSQPDSSGSSRLGGAAPLPYPPPAWRAPGSSLDRPVVLENCTPLPPYRACHCGRIKTLCGYRHLCCSTVRCQTKDPHGYSLSDTTHGRQQNRRRRRRGLEHGVWDVRRRGHHGGRPVVAPTPHVARQAQGHRHHLGAALRVRHGGDGGAADQRADQGARVAVRHVLGVHHGAGGCAHLRAHDLHLPAAQHRRRQQTAGAGAGGRVPARAHARLHRAGVGLLHSAGALPVPGRGGHPVLGQVLGLLVHGRVGRHRDRGARADRVRRLRRALLPQAGRAQVRELRGRHPGAGGHEAAARLGHAGPLQGVREGRPDATLTCQAPRSCDVILHLLHPTRQRV